MATTSLPFYRKNQSLADMENERPKSIAALRQAILNATDEVEENMKKVAREFNGGKRHEDEVRHVLPAIKHMMDTFEFTYINSAEQMDEIVEMTLEPSEVFRFDMLASTVVKDYHRKLIDFLPERFQEILDDLKKILVSLNMYCLSFCPSDTLAQSKAKKKNVYLETPVHYSLKRKDYAKTIEMHIKNIENMSKAYRSEAGVSVKVFGLTTNELARRCDCGDVPVLLLFPEACFNVKYACAGIRKWVETDRDYDEFIRNDIDRLDERKLDHSKVVNENKQKIGNIDYNIKSTRREITKLEGEMANMAKSEKLVLERIEKLEMDIKVMDIELIYQEEQRKKIRENAVNNPNMTEAELVEKLNEIAKVISKLRLDLPETRNKILSVKNKQKVVIDKRELLNRRMTELKDLDKQKILARGYGHEAKIEMEKIDTALAVLKEIYMKKTSPDLTKKLFNSMPVQPRNLKHMPKRRRPIRNRPDPLERATHVVSNQIENNWTELYRALPFYPPRGDCLVDGDIDKTAQKHYRVQDKYKARESLHKWRARNTLANVESLKDTLRKMGKQDIVEEIERKKRKPEPTQKAIAKQNWKRLKKFKFTLGKIMALQTKTHKNKIDSQREEEGTDTARREQFLEDLRAVRHRVPKDKVMLKSSAILMGKTVKKKPYPVLPKIKAY